MAKKYSPNDIPNKQADWGKDTSYYNYPFSGRAVQKFIKQQLDTKAGYFVLDSNNENYLIFSDIDNYNLYLSDPLTYANLLICTIPINGSLVDVQEDGFYICDPDGYVIFSATENGINYVDKINLELVSNVEYDINI